MLNLVKEKGVHPGLTGRIWAEGIGNINTGLQSLNYYIYFAEKSDDTTMGFLAQCTQWVDYKQN